MVRLTGELELTVGVNAICLYVLALAKIGDLSSVYPAFHTMPAEMGSSTPETPNWKRGRK